jgi:hypothetical protein
VVTKLKGDAGVGVPPTIDTSYNHGTGQIILSTNPTAPGITGPICLQPIANNAMIGFNQGSAPKSAAQDCASAGGTAIPTTARPIGTPTVVVRADGLGFQVLTGWYDATVSNDCGGGNSFNYGKSYITVHEFGADANWYQVAGVTVTNAVLTGITFAGAAVFVDGITKDNVPATIDLGENFSVMQKVVSNPGLERFTRTTWTERVD